MNKIFLPKVMTMGFSDNPSDVKIFKITDKTLEIAKNYILNDGLVAFPTETVYGLGANALSSQAIKNCYAAKGRPQDNPLIVHVHKDYDISTLVYDDKAYVKKLRDAFLPGPLTLVYKSRDKVSDLVSGGLDTLAIRVPKSEGAQRFLKYLDIPIAAPSANVSKHTSPVTADHVYGDFGDNISMILDGGRCEGGIESTVMDVTGDCPVILRKGLITAEMVKAVVGRCEYARSSSDLNKRSPGTKYRHYCPKTKTVLFECADFDGVKNLYKKSQNDGLKVLIMCREADAAHFDGLNVYSLGSTGNEMASRLYFGLHVAEEYDLLIGLKFPISDEVTLSVENRFLKAFG